MKGKAMTTLTNAEMRAIELNLEQMDRLLSYAKYRSHEVTMDVIVHEFYETLNGSQFEYMVLRKIGALLAPESQEDLNLTVRI